VVGPANVWRSSQASCPKRPITNRQKLTATQEKDLLK
jgi:hypothetical protein